MIVNMNDFIENCKKCILVAVDYGDNRDELYHSLCATWYCKTSQNRKALIMSTHDKYSDVYWEITYNSHKDKYFINEYHKKSNTEITLPKH